jgi:hypothetical protein
VTNPATQGPLGAPYLAVDVQPDNLEGTFTLDVSELDGPDMLGWLAEDAGTWVNVVCDVRTVSSRRGATRLLGVLTRAEAGMATVVVDDWSGLLDPLLNGNSVHKGTPFRLRAWGWSLDPDTLESVEWSETLFTGEVDQLEAEYLPGQPATVTVTAVDLIAPLAAWEAEGRAGDGVGAGDDLLGRVQRVLDEVDRGTVDVANSDAGYAATLLPTRLQRAWDDIAAAADAELGRVWVDVDNRLVIRGRNSVLTGPIRGTLSDVHGEAVEAPHTCMSAATVVHGVELLANRVLGSRRALEGEDPATLPVVRRDDTYSQARYGIGTVDRAGQLELQTSEQVTPWAEAVALAGAEPELRVDTVTPSPTEHVLEEALQQWPAVMATRIGDRWRFRFHPLNGHTVDRVVGVLGVELDLSPESWTVRWTTTEAAAGNWFTLDVSELDGVDVLAPFSVPVPAA